ncbi:MAG: ftsH [Rickettsiaceae bacterium]|jgi:cell division protease FtsH|nr:ftsH [Rickettsiaceae bacterium]
MQAMPNKTPNNKKNFLIWLAIFLVVMFISSIFGGEGGLNANKISFSQFIAKVDGGEVAKVDIKGKDLIGTLKSGEEFYTFLPEYPNLVEKLQEKNIEVNASPLVSKSEKIIGGILGWLPFLIMIFLWFGFMRNMGGAGNKAFSFGKSKAKLLQEAKGKVTFADVAGIDEAKGELSELVDFLKEPGKYIKLGARIPRGCLLIGSPGTGKTLLARAIAGEAGVPFFSISGSDFVEMFVGVGASRVRDMFEQGKKNAPCIIFIDEIDAVGRHRGSGIGGGNDEREQTLNQLLVEMDGFSDNEGVIVIAATNRPDVLDKALLRPGRFDRQIVVPAPDIIGREQILNVHIKKVQTAPDVDIKQLARGTPGFSGADLANLVNESALLAAKSNQMLVTMQNLEDAKDKIMMGAERKSMVMQQDEKILTAYHEGGHALVSLNCANSDPIHKATIIPRGRALGLVMRLPEVDRFSVSRAKLHDDLAVAMAGRAAEELVFGYDKVTTGASSDIEQATKMAKAMVTKWGLSDKVGTVDYGADRNGQSYGNENVISEETTKLIDSETKRIVDEALQRAKKILTEKRSDLEILAKGLLEFETLSGDEIKDLLAGKEVRRAADAGKRTLKSVIPNSGE